MRPSNHRWRRKELCSRCMRTVISETSALVTGPSTPSHTMSVLLNIFRSPHSIARGRRNRGALGFQVLLQHGQRTPGHADQVFVALYQVPHQGVRLVLRLRAIVVERLPWVVLLVALVAVVRECDERSREVHQQAGVERVLLTLCRIFW